MPPAGVLAAPVFAGGVLVAVAVDGVLGAGGVAVAAATEVFAGSGGLSTVFTG